MKNIPTLYEWAGDMPTFETLFARFYDKVLADDLLGEVFKHMSPEHVAHVAHFVAEVFGSEKMYTTTDGGSHARMIGQHVGKMLTEEKRQRWVQLLLQTADEVGLKSDPEFRSAFVGYIEWGDPAGRHQLATDRKSDGRGGTHAPLGVGGDGRPLYSRTNLIRHKYDSLRL